MKNVWLFGALLATLTACSDGSSSSASNTSPTASAIRLQGVPSDTVTAGSEYVFTPGLSSGSLNGIRFAVAGLPVWAQFDVRTGTLSGTPAMGAVGLNSNILISARDGRSAGTIGPFTIRVVAPSAAGGATTASAAPSIGGIPAGVVLVGQAYSFTPTATDSTESTLTFSVQNPPLWASFNSVTGELSGTPTLADVGTFSNIRVSVSDGTHTATLAVFSIAVTETAPGTATLTWVPPTENTDGTPLTDLSGYLIYYGSRADALTQTITVDNAGTTDYVVGNLTPGTWYFAIAAVTTVHTHSLQSAVQRAAVL